jgi:hypothetical protein
MLLSAIDARTAEQEARKQRSGFAHLLRADEGKAPTSADIMRIHRAMASATDGSMSYDAMLSESTTERLFQCGALYFARLG